MPWPHQGGHAQPTSGWGLGSSWPTCPGVAPDHPTPQKEGVGGLLGLILYVAWTRKFNVSILKKRRKDKEKGARPTLVLAARVAR